MSYKRLGAAALLIVAAVYFRVCMPAWYETIFPSVREVLAEDQVFLPDVQTIEAWFGWN